jgi:predicted tellurium resistance membrane protein TerC
MLDNWVFIAAIVIMVTANILYVSVLLQQYKLFKVRTSLQPLKILLFCAVLLLIIGALPLMIVYANIVWFHYNHLWLVYAAVLLNAFAKLVTGIMLRLIYRFRLSDGINEDLF